MSEMSERDGLATLLAAHRLYGEDGDDTFECGCGAKSSPEALEEDFGEQLWHERHVAGLLTARVADAAAAARAEVIEALIPLRRFAEAKAITAQARAIEGRDWLDVLALLDLLAPPVDHAHAAGGTEVGA